jgi:WD40 repeat protein
VLCLLDGLTRDEAAGRLGYSLATLKRRLDAGRELLRARLLRRGVAPVALAAAALDPAGLRAAVPPALAAAVVRSASVLRPLPSVVSWAARALVLLTTGAVLAGAAALGPARPQTPAAAASAARPPEPPTPAAAALPRGVTAVYGTLRFHHPDHVVSIGSSADGTLLAVADRDTVSVYEAATWKPLHRFTAANGMGTWDSGHTLAFSPAGDRLGFVKNGEAAFVWDVRTGRLIRQFDSGERWRWQSFCGFTPDGLFILADKTGLLLHDPATGVVVRTVTAERVTRLSPDGRFFIHYPHSRTAPGATTEPVLGDTRTGADLRRFEGPDRWGALSSGVAFTPDGSAVAALPGNGWGVHLWSTDTGRRAAGTDERPAFTSPTWLHARSRGAALGFTADGRTLFLLLADGDIARWDVATRKELPRLKAGDGQKVDPSRPRGAAGLHALPDGKTLLTPCENGWVRVWDAATGAERPVPERYRELNLAISPDGRAMAAGDASGRIDLWESATGRLLRTLRASGEPVRQMTFSPDGRLLVVAEGRFGQTAEDRTSQARVISVADGRGLRTFAAKDDGPRSVWSIHPLGFLPDGRPLLDYYPREVRVFDAGTGEQIRAFHASSFGAALGPDRRTLATGDGDDVVLIDATTGTATKRIPVLAPGDVRTGPRPQYRFGWSADGKTLACALPGDVVAVLDPESGRVRSRFPGFPGPEPKGLRELARGVGFIQVAAVSPDGKWVFTAAMNGRAGGVWEAVTGSPVALLDAGFGVTKGFFTPDGRSVVTVGSGVGFRWDLAAVLAPDPKATPAESWEAAAGADAGKAAGAAAGLVGTGPGRELLRGELPPVKLDVTDARVSRWVADLASDDFGTREAASKELAARARLIEPALRAAVAASTDPEVRRRLSAALAATGPGPTRDELRAVRVVRAAELAGTPEARELLKAWAGGAAGAVLTEDARVALVRVGRSTPAGRD